MAVFGSPPPRIMISGCRQGAKDADTLRQYPHGYWRMTRGRCGSLLLHRDGLAPSTPCRSPGALRSTPDKQTFSVRRHVSKVPTATFRNTDLPIGACYLMMQCA